MQKFLNIYLLQKVNSGQCDENEFLTKIKKGVGVRVGFSKCKYFKQNRTLPLHTEAIPSKPAGDIF